MARLGDLFELQRETEWRRAGATEQDIEHSRASGMDARDIAALRSITRSLSLCIVIRSPKAAARVWHGLLPPKTWATKAKTNAAGVVSGHKGTLMVSDYDLRSVWRWQDNAYSKVFMSAAQGRSHGSWPRESVSLMQQLNRVLVSRLQHGCQDDFQSPLNPGVKPEDHFMVFDCGAATFLPDPAACARFYAEAGLAWPYDAAGRYIGAVHRG